MRWGKAIFTWERFFELVGCLCVNNVSNNWVVCCLASCLQPNNAVDWFCTENSTVKTRLKRETWLLQRPPDLWTELTNTNRQRFSRFAQHLARPLWVPRYSVLCCLCNSGSCEPERPELLQCTETASRKLEGFPLRYYSPASRSGSTAPQVSFFKDTGSFEVGKTGNNLRKRKQPVTKLGKCTVSYRSIERGKLRNWILVLRKYSQFESTSDRNIENWTL